MSDILTTLDILDNFNKRLEALEILAGIVGPDGKSVDATKISEAARVNQRLSDQMSNVKQVTVDPGVKLADNIQLANEAIKK